MKSTLTNMSTQPRTTLRALVGARVSVMKDDGKVSHLAQTKTGTDWATSHGHTVVGTFEDLDISAGKFTPWQRPDLGKWLTDERHWEWDILVFSKMDRAFRSTNDCVDLARWCKERNKILVFAEDNLTLNYLNPEPGLEGMMSELFVYIGAFFAQLELNRFQTRSRDAHRIVRQTDRWVTGIPRIGFQTAPHPSGKGRCLIHDPEGQKTLHRIRDMLFEGESWTQISLTFNRERVLTNLDRSRLKSGKPLFENPWSTPILIRLMTSLGTQGIKVDSKQNPILTANGEMIQMTDPSFTDDDWSRIQSEVAKRSTSGKKRVNSENPVLGVAYCGQCGGQLTQHFPVRKGAKYHYIRCANTKTRCKVFMRADRILTMLDEQFLEHYGSRQVTKRKLVPGSDNRAELERVKGSIQRLRDESDAGLIVSDEDHAQYISRLKGLTDRKNALEATPVIPSRWVEETTGETNAEAWARLGNDAVGRRDMLRDAGIKLIVHSKFEIHIMDVMDTEEGFKAYQRQLRTAETSETQPDDFPPTDEPWGDSDTERLRRLIRKNLLGNA